MQKETYLTPLQAQEIREMMNETAAALMADENEKALQLGSELWEFAENILDALPDEAPVSFDFENVFQEIIYAFRVQKRPKHVDAILPMSRILLMYGLGLMRAGRHEEAQPILERATGWNPVGPQAALAYAECCKNLDDRAKLLTVTKDILTFAVKREDIARCYRNLGWYLASVADYEAAKGCYLFSQGWENDPSVAEELQRIDREAGRKVEDPDIEQLKAFAEKYNFQLGPSRDVVGLAYNYGREMLAQRQYESARYFLSIADNLIEDEGLKQMLAQLDKEEKAAQEPPQV